MDFEEKDMSDKNETIKFLVSPGLLDDEFDREADLETLVNYKIIVATVISYLC